MRQPYHPHRGNLTHWFTALATVILFWAGQADPALGDGTETLGPPGTPVASGSGFVAAGVGVKFSQPGSLTIDVPTGVNIVQVLVYWEGLHEQGTSGDDTIDIDGHTITGQLIGGPAFYYNAQFPVVASSFRAEITGLALVVPGTNTLSISGLSFNDGVHGEVGADGVGIVVVYDDGASLSDIQLRDGVDLAYLNFPAPRQATEPQVFTFEAADQDRTADLLFFVAGVEDNLAHPNAIEIVGSDGNPTLLVNVLRNNEGFEWDTYIHQVTIPAGATQLTVEVKSYDDGSGADPASLAWVAAGFSVPIDKVVADEFCAQTAYYWLGHQDAWPTDELVLGADLYGKAELVALFKYIGLDISRLLARQLGATKLNVAAGSSDEIGPVVSKADAFLTTYPPGTRFTWGQLEQIVQAARLAIHLLAYNAAPCSDDTHLAKTGTSDVEDEMRFLESLPDRYLAEIPDAFALESAYPNPFNPATTIGYSLPGESHVRLAVFDLLGREVAVLVDDEITAGRHEAVFDASNLPSGTYIYRIATSFGTATGRVVLSK